VPAPHILDCAIGAAELVLTLLIATFRNHGMSHEVAKSLLRRLGVGRYKRAVGCAVKRGVIKRTQPRRTAEEAAREGTRRVHQFGFVRDVVQFTAWEVPNFKTITVRRGMFDGLRVDEAAALLYITAEGAQNNRCIFTRELAERFGWSGDRAVKVLASLRSKGLAKRLHGGRKGVRYTVADAKPARRKSAKPVATLIAGEEQHRLRSEIPADEIAAAEAKLSAAGIGLAVLEQKWLARTRRHGDEIVTEAGSRVDHRVPYFHSIVKGILEDEAAKRPKRGGASTAIFAAAKARLEARDASRDAKAPGKLVAVPTSRPEFHITPHRDRVQWGWWEKHLIDKGEAGLLGAARSQGVMIVECKSPKDDTPLPRIPAHTQLGQPDAVRYGGVR